MLLRFLRSCLFLFQSFFPPLFFRLYNFCWSVFKFIDFFAFSILLLSLSSEFFISDIFFNSKIYIWFFFLVPVSLLRTYIFPFISKVCSPYLREHDYDSCLQVFDNFNVWVTLEWHLPIIFSLWRLVTFFWFLIYWAVLDYILDILSTILWDSGFY